MNIYANRGTSNVKTRTILCQAITILVIEGLTTITVARVTVSIDTTLEVPSCPYWV